METINPLSELANIGNGIASFTTSVLVTKELLDVTLEKQKDINNDLSYKLANNEKEISVVRAEAANAKRDTLILAKLETDPELILGINNIERVEALVEKNPEYIKHLLYPNVKMLFTAVNKAPELLPVILEKSKNVIVKEEDIQYKLITTALKNNYANAKYIPYLDDKMMDRLIEFNPFILEHYRFDCKEHQYFKAIQTDANVFQFVPHPTMEQIELAIKLNYDNIAYSPAFTEHLAISVLMRTYNPRLLKSNKNYFESLAIACWYVNSYSSGLGEVENQTLALCKIAKRTYGNIICQYIRNPFKRFYVRLFCKG